MNGMENDYYNWLCSFVNDGQHSNLMSALYNKEFTYFIAMDGNRAEDGMALREKYERNNGKKLNMDIWKKPCNVLEMMVALSIRCETFIMGNSVYGDRTRLWFWKMIDNMGLTFMTDSKFNPEKTDYVLNRFLCRQYDSDGKGGLFIIKDPPADLRSIEIWMQMNWYLNNY